MRPRHQASEKTRSRRGSGLSEACFNEAEASSLGKVYPVTRSKMDSLASMRPRHQASEKLKDEDATVAFVELQ